MSPQPIALLLARAYPPYSGEPQADAESLAKAAQLEAQGYEVEVISESAEGDEFVHLDPAGRFVHRVHPDRSYLSKGLPLRQLGQAYPARVLEKVLELTSLWGREVLRLEVSGEASQAAFVRRVPSLRRAMESPTPAPPRAEVPAPSPIGSVDLIVCTYNRVDDLRLSMPSLLREVARARSQGVACELTLVHQNPETPALLQDLVSHQPHVRWVFSSPPGLPRARNAGVASTRGDLVVFVDDDVLLDEGFVLEHVAAATAHPRALGVAGRTKSRHEGERGWKGAAIGQVRFSGAVDANFDSLHDASTVVVHTPLGANMSFRREEMARRLGAAWFDERLEGSAHREESTLTVRLFRERGHLVFAPRASLYHFEATRGGCENRGERSVETRLAHRSLDYLFLHRLYAPLGEAGAFGPLLLLARDVRHAQGVAEALEEVGLGLRAYRKGRGLYRQFE